MEFPHVDVVGGGCLGLVWLLAAIYALVHVLGSRASVLGKVLWVVLIFAFPCGGLVLWALLGPRQTRL